MMQMETEPQDLPTNMKHMTRYSLGIRQRTKPSSQDRDDMRKKEYLVAVFLIWSRQVYTLG
jgi:hypothetical protein